MDDSDFKFGIEIEFVSSLLDNVKERLKNKNFDSTGWKVKFEHLVSYYNDVNNVVGGEVVSPILNINNADYNAIRGVLKELKEEGSKINGETGFHVHINADYLGDNLSYLNLLELWMSYENIIYKYGFDKVYNGRISLLYFAKPLNFKREAYLKIIDTLRERNANFFIARDFLDEDIFDYYFSKEYGLNLRNIIHSDSEDGKFDDKKTVEFRCCDGSLDEKFIINTVDIFKKIVDISKNGALDIDYLRYRNCRDVNTISVNKFSENNEKDLEEFLGLLNLSPSLDDYFIKQYYKR